MASSAHAIAVPAIPSPSRQLAREHLFQVVSEDWYSQSESSMDKSSNSESLARRLQKKISKVKVNANKFVQWLREVENVWTQNWTWTHINVFYA